MDAAQYVANKKGFDRYQLYDFELGNAFDKPAQCRQDAWALAMSQASRVMNPSVTSIKLVRENDTLV